MRTLIRNLCTVEEFIFVFSMSRISGFACRLSVVSTALFALTGIGSRAGAQTAPQLLPYTSKLIAGGGAALNAGKCPVTGVTATDTYGDGCLATEIVLTAPRYAIVDSAGAVFFSDYTNGLIRRIDPITGIVTAVAGGAPSSPAATKACGAYMSTDSDGDGCLGTAVKLGKPTGLAFDASGNLYFADYSYSNVREIAATPVTGSAVGLITTSGVISNVVGQTTYGYNVNNTAPNPPVIAATQGYLNDPYGIAFDAAGNLYIADEGNNAVEVVNLTKNSEQIQGQTVPAGSISKLIGYGNLATTTPKTGASATSGDCPDFQTTTYRGGCDYGNFTNGVAAVKSNVDSVYGVAVDASGNLYFANEYDNNVGLVSASTTLVNNYAGVYPLSSNGVKQAQTQRAAAGFGIGSDFGLALDTNSNLYVTDALNGYVWRIDGTTQSMYVVAGGGSTTCGTVDAFGDGCPALQATFSKSGTSYASTGVFGVTVDSYADLFLGDEGNNLIREVASGTQFGNVGATQTDLIDIHFAPGDGPASTGAYSLTAGAANFTLGTATCTTNVDNNPNAGNTTDCILPVTANPTVLGAFMGTLQVVSSKGGTATFLLTGNYIQSPVSRVVVTATASGAASCGTGASIYPTTSTITLTAKLTANGPSAPGGTITFSSNGTALAPTTGIAVTNIGTTSAPVYGATMTYTFPTAAAYTITATYSGDTYFKTSTTATPATFSTSLPGFSMSAGTNQQATVAAGQTALYSFNLAQNVYTGTITFSCSGLPANASCVFNPSSITASGCSTTSLIALSILTQQGTPVAVTAGIGGRWQVFGVFTGLTLALLVGIRRRRVGMHLGHIWMSLAMLLAASSLVACGSGAKTSPTPAGTSTVTVTATGSAGTVATFTVPLTVTAY